MTLALSFATLAALSSEPQAPAPGRARAEPPPSMVLVEGGVTAIGSTELQVAEIGKANPVAYGNLVCETPRHERRVADFFLMVTEVTNEQYAAFVRATGVRPPEHWGVKAIEKAGEEFVRAQEEQRERAVREGRTPAEPLKFERSTWWREHWREAAWELPAGAASAPVVYVDVYEADAYARWAGLRLMTEFEFQRAGRGRTDRLYPWGDEPDPMRAVVAELKVKGKLFAPSAPLPVASLPAGATALGIHDLSGNAWEWTSSPFSPYPGYKQLKILVGAGRSAQQVDGVTHWNPDQRVVVGGGYPNSLMVARLTTRRPSNPDQSAFSLGFRCAASATPGLDVANVLMADVLPPRRRPKHAQFDLERVVLAEHWTDTPGSALSNDLQSGASAPIAGYRVIEAHDYVLFVPAIEIQASTVKELGEASRRSAPVPLGVLALTKPSVEPRLAPGAYFVAYRGAGPLLAADGLDEKPAPAADSVRLRTPADVDTGVDTLIFCGADGGGVAWLPAPAFEYAHPPAPRVALEPGTAEQPTRLRLEVTSWVRESNKGFNWPLALAFAAGDVGADWRRP